MSEEDEIYESIAAFGLEDGIPAILVDPLEEAQQGEETLPKMPLDISEESGISGLLLTTQMAELLGVPEVELTEEMYQGLVACPYVEEARTLAPRSEGAPIVGKNEIKIQIGAEEEAGSQADHILVTFGVEDRVTFPLLGPYETTKFHPGFYPSWDFAGADYRAFTERIPTDAWDVITLRNPFDDPLRIEHIWIVHSGVTILDYDCNCWLDRSGRRQFSKLGLGPLILREKMRAVYNSHIPQLHWAARELGKTDGRKYESLDSWCSEFASWCLRKGLWQTPTGNIGNVKMRDWFANEGRLYTKQDVLDGDYVLTPGDYLRYRMAGSSDHHSVLFLRYIDDPNNPTDSTKIETIAGNTEQGHTVAVRQRTLARLCEVGCTR